MNQYCHFCSADTTFQFKFVDTTFHIKFPNIISDTTCDFCEQNISKLKGIEIKLSVIIENYECLKSNL